MAKKKAVKKAVQKAEMNRKISVETGGFNTEDIWIGGTSDGLGLGITTDKMEQFLVKLHEAQGTVGKAHIMVECEVCFFLSQPEIKNLLSQLKAKDKPAPIKAQAKPAPTTKKKTAVKK